MAEFADHISQADHNRSVASHLLNQESFHDWAVTAAFYAAIHYFEAWLYDQPEKHTEENVPVEQDGSLKYTVHGWRETLVTKKLSREGFKAYRQLKEASETARYLSNPRATTGSKWTGSGAWIFIPVTGARHLVERDLNVFTGALDLDLARFLHTIDFESTVGVTAPIIRRKLIADYGTKEKLLAEREDEIRRKYGADVLAAFKRSTDQR